MRLSQMLFIGWLIFCICPADAKWVAMTPEDAASTKCLRISGSRTEMCATKFNARPDGGFTFELSKCESAVTIIFGSDNGLNLYENEMSRLTSPAVVTVSMNGDVHSDAIKDLTPSIKPIQVVDDHVEIGIGYVGDAIGCSAVLTQGYPVVEVPDPTEYASAGTGLTDSQTIGLVAGVGGAIGIGILVVVFVYCHVKKRNGKQALMEVPMYLGSDLTGVNCPIRVQRRASKKKTADNALHRNGPSTETGASTQIKKMMKREAKEGKRRSRRKVEEDITDGTGLSRRDENKSEQEEKPLAV